MASTFNSPACCWRIRTDGDDLNGGGFVSSVSGATVDYTDFAAAIINSTTGTCTVGSTTWTDTGVTFPSDLKGNVIFISAKTGGSATALDRFVVMSVTDANNIVLDRSPCASANITAATYRIGGALADIKSFAISATGSFSAPTIATPLIPGNTIFQQGDGTSDPSTATYDYSAGTYVFPSSNKTAGGGGPIKWIGYNGTPRIDHCGGLVTADWDTENISFFRKLGTNVNFAVVHGASGQPITVAQDCIFDQNGYDSREYYGAFGGIFRCRVRNTGGGAAGTNVVISVQHPACGVVGNYISGVRGVAISTKGPGGSGTNSTSASICYNIVANNLSDGIVIDCDQSDEAYGFGVFNNTVYNNGGHGVVFKSVNTTCSTTAYAAFFNNIVSHHTGSGKVAVFFDTSFTLNRRFRHHPIDYNCYYGNTTIFNQVSSADTWVLQPHDITADPGYANAAGENFATGIGVRSMGLSGPLGTANSKVNIGAFQGAGAGFFSRFFYDMNQGVCNV